MLTSGMCRESPGAMQRASFMAFANIAVTPLVGRALALRGGMRPASVASFSMSGSGLESMVQDKINRFACRNEEFEGQAQKNDRCDRRSRMYCSYRTGSVGRLVMEHWPPL